MVSMTTPEGRKVSVTTPRIYRIIQELRSTPMPTLAPATQALIASLDDRALEEVFAAIGDREEALRSDADQFLQRVGKDLPPEFFKSLKELLAARPDDVHPLAYASLSLIWENMDYVQCIKWNASTGFLEVDVDKSNFPEVASNRDYTSLSGQFQCLMPQGSKEAFEELRSNNTNLSEDDLEVIREEVQYGGPWCFKGMITSLLKDEFDRIIFMGREAPKYVLYRDQSALDFVGELRGDLAKLPSATQNAVLHVVATEYGSWNFKGKVTSISLNEEHEFAELNLFEGKTEYIFQLQSGAEFLQRQSAEFFKEIDYADLDYVIDVILTSEGPWNLRGQITQITQNKAGAICFHLREGGSHMLYPPISRDEFFKMHIDTNKNLDPETRDFISKIFDREDLGLCRKGFVKNVSGNVVDGVEFKIPGEKKSRWIFDKQSHEEFIERHIEGNLYLTHDLQDRFRRLRSFSGSPLGLRGYVLTIEPLKEDAVITLRGGGTCLLSEIERFLAG